MPEDQGTARRATWRKRARLAAISTFGSLVLVELLLRVAWTNPYRHEAPERFVQIRMQHANVDSKIDRHLLKLDPPVVPFRTDSRGYLLPSRRFEHPDATIAFVGGSTTECSAVDEPLRFPALVSTTLEARGLKVNSLNAGRSGNTVHDALNVVLNHLVEDHPDAVVLMEAANDIGVLKQAGSYEPREDEPETASNAMRYFVQRLSATSSFAGLVRHVATHATASPGHYEGTSAASVARDAYERRLHAFVGICRAFDIKPVLMTQPLSSMRNELTPDWADSAAQDVFNEVVRRVGAAENVTVIDLAMHLQKDIPGWNEPMKLFYDGMHVNDAGSRVYADYIAARLTESVIAAR